ncbi:MAG: MFS transporter [Anaerolineales bacterium]|nr:MFS transporter [Anaerolineales bacterium]
MFTFRALKHRSFALLWSGQTLSRLGDFVYEIALSWWILQKTGSAEAMGLMWVFVATPSVLFLLLGGAMVDRLPRIVLMVISDMGRAMVVLFVAGLAYFDQLQVWHIYATSFFFGMVDAFFTPAYFAVVPQVVPEEDLSSANALTSISSNLGRVVGPSLGAWIVAWVGNSAAFFINGASFLISAGLLIPLFFAKILAPTPSENHILEDIRAGVRVVLSKPWLWITIAIYSLINVTLIGPYVVAMPFLVSDFMKEDVTRLGFLLSIFPIGYVIGGTWLGRYSKLPCRGILMNATLALAAIMLSLYGLHLPLWTLVVAALVNGIALQAGMLAWTHLLQEKIPNEQLGRVSSIDQMGSLSLMPIGMYLAGVLTEKIGPSPVFLFGGGITALVALLAITHPAIRNLD